MMNLQLPPRRYRTASAEGTLVMLDDKELRSPLQRPLNLPTHALASALAQEWDAQEKQVDPRRMPQTQLVMTAVDRVADNRVAVQLELMRYLETELICHYGDHPKLVAYQQAQWQDLHHWLRENFGVTLPVTHGIQPIRSTSEPIWLADYLASLDLFQLTALQLAVSVLGSLVIGLALVEKQLSATAALRAAEAETFFQAQQWGLDPDTAKRHDSQLAELRVIEKFLGMIG